MTGKGAFRKNVGGNGDSKGSCITQTDNYILPIFLLITIQQDSELHNLLTP